MSTEERACALDETRYRASADESRSLTVIREGVPRVGTCCSLAIARTHNSPTLLSELLVPFNPPKRPTTLVGRCRHGRGL